MNLTTGGRTATGPLWAQNVIVLAQNFTLTQTQSHLLYRGLTFTPTIQLQKHQKMQLELDLQTYHRRVQLAAYFKNSGKTQRLIRPFRPPSTWIPPKEQLPPEIPFLINRDRKDFKKHYDWYVEKPNFTEEEQMALMDLARNKHIVIKPADKGSSVVILGREQYIQEATRQLNDNTYYVKLKEPIFIKTVPQVHTIIDMLHNKHYIDAKQKQYLKGDQEPRPRRFYILPKIHKDPQKWTVPHIIPPGRPIVSDCGSETCRTAEYLEHYLHPLSIKHPAYLKDTYHFLSLIKGIRAPADSFFFTMDVDSLYTNIDIQAGIRTVADFFQRYPDPSRPDRELLELLEINLTKNDFTFNGEFYLQIKGAKRGLYIIYVTWTTSLVSGPIRRRTLRIFSILWTLLTPPFDLNTL